MSASRPMGVWLAFAWALPVVFAADPGSVPAKPDAVDFNRDVRPILSKHCFACHGEDASHRAAGLRLDQREAALKVLKSGHAAIVPGKVEASELIRRIVSSDPEARMPPDEAQNPLTPQQITTLKAWIAQGAPYAQHWAFVKPVRPPLPQVADAAWAKQPWDAFILARQTAQGLAPSPQADRFTLLRRVSLDVRGLPPSLEEIQAFERDQRPDAYEHMVDRFLADPAFGERWARVWLDLARYADSAGYGSDPLRRNIYRYRDWVIEAFNQNLPYDQFTRDQLAGDLLPNPTPDQRLATAFHRNTMTNTEGGTDDEEFRVAAVKDRVNTTMQVWMGLTMGCASCHSHKYDPISQKDYYRFFAIFNQTADNDQPDESPTLPMPTAEQKEKLRQIDEQIAAARQELAASTPELAAAQTAWEASLQSKALWQAVLPTRARASSSTQFETLPDSSLRVTGPASARETYTLEIPIAPSTLTALRLEVLPDPAHPKGGSGRAADGNFVLSQVAASLRPAQGNLLLARYVRITLPGPNQMLSLAEVEAFAGSVNVARDGRARQSSTDFDGLATRAIDGNTEGDYYKANSVTHTRAEKDPWWEVEFPEAIEMDRLVIWNRTDGGLGVRLRGAVVEVLGEQRRVLWSARLEPAPGKRTELRPADGQQITLSQAVADYSQEKFPVAATLANEVNRKTGWAVGPRQAEPHAAVFSLGQPLTLGSPAVLVLRLKHDFEQPGYALGRFRLSTTDDPRLPKRSGVPADVLAIVDRPVQERTPEQAGRVAAYYRSIAPELQPVRDRIAALEKSKPVPTNVPVMVELPKERRRKTHLLTKGDFLNPGEVVEPGLPTAFHRLSDDASPDRLAVARWLTHPDNPLTARVAVNRFWAQLFGTGLVETEEDFGTQGELPSHPALLDWLAVEFQDALKWDMKALLRQIVTSATYRQAAVVSPELLAKDPSNRWLTRGPRHRLEAEMVRDQALALSGLLSRKLGGPSVFPPQPPGLWQAAFNGERTWATSSGPDRYRRGLYTFWRRTIPYPSMAAFDAPSRELCAIKRSRSNTPVQAFVTLNDPVYVECAQALARRIIQEGGDTTESRVRFGLLLCLARPPADVQVQRLVSLFETERAAFAQDPDAARKLATEPLGPLPAGLNAVDAAAWTVVANVLLNLDAVLTKG